MSNSGPKTIANDVHVRFGALESIGRLLPLQNTADKKETKTFLITPCEHHSRVNQFYIPESCECRSADQPKGWTTGKLAKGKEQNGKVIVFEQEQIEEIRSSDLEKNQIDLFVCDAAEFESQCQPTGSSYWFEPSQIKGAYAAIMTLVADTSRAFYGTLLLRSEKLYRALPHPEGGLMLQEHLRPSEMWHYNAPPVDVTETDVAIANAIADTMMEKFDPEAVASTKVAKMREAMAAATGVEAAAKPVAKAVPKDDLTSVLQQALAAAQAAKLAKKAS